MMDHIVDRLVRTQRPDAFGVGRRGEHAMGGDWTKDFSTPRKPTLQFAENTIAVSLYAHCLVIFQVGPSTLFNIVRRRDHVFVESIWRSHVAKDCEYPDPRMATGKTKHNVRVGCIDAMKRLTTSGEANN